MAQTRVVWVSFAPLERVASGLTSRIASSRYRITVPAAALKKLGADVTVTYLGGHANRKTLLSRFERCDVVILGKLTAEKDEWTAEAERALDLVLELRRRGVKVIADFCDDHFTHPLRAGYSNMVANAADAVVASTPALREALQSITTQPISLVTDPVEGKRGEARVPAASGSLRLVWYGHRTNVDTLETGLGQLERVLSRRPVTVDLITSSDSDAEDIARRYSAAWAAREGACRFREWSLTATWQALADCDAVIIPSDPADPRRAVKSPNRFTEAVWAGRFVAAHPLPAYEDLAPYGWVGGDLGEGLEWLLDNPAPALNRVKAGQEAVTVRFSPEAVARQWMLVIDSVVKETSP